MYVYICICRVYFNSASNVATSPVCDAHRRIKSFHCFLLNLKFICRPKIKEDAKIIFNFVLESCVSRKLITHGNPQNFLLTSDTLYILKIQFVFLQNIFM